MRIAEFLKSNKLLVLVVLVFIGCYFINSKGEGFTGYNDVSAFLKEVSKYYSDRLTSFKMTPTDVTIVSREKQSSGILYTADVRYKFIGSYTGTDHRRFKIKYYHLDGAYVGKDIGGPKSGTTAKSDNALKVTYMVGLFTASGKIYYEGIGYRDITENVPISSSSTPSSSLDGTDTNLTSNTSKFKSSVRGKAIGGDDIFNSTDLTINQCAEECLKNDNCKSFEFSRVDNRCNLNSTTSTTAGSKYTSYKDWDYYERLPETGDGNIVNPSNSLDGTDTNLTSNTSKFKSSVRGKAIGGDDIFNSTDLTINQCAEECLKNDNCKSFEFSRVDNRCNLNSSTSTTAGSKYTSYKDWDYYERLETGEEDDEDEEDGENDNDEDPECSTDADCADGKACITGSCVEAYDYEKPDWGNFSPWSIEEDAKLTTEELDNHTDKNAKECGDLCLSEVGCKSFNFNKRTGECTHLKKSKSDDPDEFFEDEDYDHFVKRSAGDRYKWVIIGSTIGGVCISLILLVVIVMVMKKK